ncbi:MAG: hypothetical protein Q8S54_17470 [Bacteroidota bacterium]|nr:hypothetical protein [Odoribacter sp.]MDP3644960.1 hypothetical protein [Bacteroidota bacterium]
MAHFIEIAFNVAMKSFEEAEVNGNRWRMGDFLTSKWLQKKNINFDEIVEFSKNMPDSKIVVIGEGPSEGFYIYSQKQKTCYKFEQKLAEV